MNDNLPREDEDDDDMLERYQRGLSQDVSGPSDSVRRAILADAARMAAAHVPAQRVDLPRESANDPRWRRTIVGTLAAAVLVGLVVVPLMRLPSAGPENPASRLPAAPALPMPPTAPAPPLAAQSPTLSSNLGKARPAEAARALASARDQAGSEVEARDSAGRTALMLAVVNSHADAVDGLIARGADVNAADARGMRPLQAARLGGHRQIIESLERAGAR